MCLKVILMAVILHSLISIDGSAQKKDTTIFIRPFISLKYDTSLFRLKKSYEPESQKSYTFYSKLNPEERTNILIIGSYINKVPGKNLQDSLCHGFIDEFKAAKDSLINIRNVGTMFHANGFSCFAATITQKGLRQSEPIEPSLPGDTAFLKKVKSWQSFQFREVNVKIKKITFDTSVIDKITQYRATMNILATYHGKTYNLAPAFIIKNERISHQDAKLNGTELTFRYNACAKLQSTYWGDPRYDNREDDNELLMVDGLDKKYHVYIQGLNLSPLGAGRLTYFSTKEKDPGTSYSLDSIVLKKLLDGMSFHAESEISKEDSLIKAGCTINVEPVNSTIYDDFRKRYAKYAFAGKLIINSKTKLRIVQARTLSEGGFYDNFTPDAKGDIFIKFHKTPKGQITKNAEILAIDSFGNTFWIPFKFSFTSD